MQTTATSKTPKAPATESATAEVRRVKAELAARFNFDVTAMLRDARGRQAQSGHKVVDRSKGV